MRWLEPHDPLLYSRVLALALAIVLILAGARLILPFAVPALLLLAASAVVVRWLVVRRGAGYTVSDLPPALILHDLGIVGLWMAATSPIPGSPSFVLVIAVGVLAVYRLGARGLIWALVAYLAGRLVQEGLRIEYGLATPAVQLLEEAAVVIVVMAVVGVVAHSYRRQQQGLVRTLERARSLERIALDIGAEDDPERVLQRIPSLVLPTLGAERAALIVRRGGQWLTAAVAGGMTVVVGTLTTADAGLLGDVVRERRALTTDDYSGYPGAARSSQQSGLRAALGAPIFVHGELAAVLLLFRSERVAFTPEDVAFAEALAAQVALAVAGARAIEQARRVEVGTRLMAVEGTRDELIARIAGAAVDVFSAEFVLAVWIDAGRTRRVVAALGSAARLTGEAGQPLGELLGQVSRTGEPAALRDAETLAADFAPASGLCSAIAAPIVLDEVVIAAIVIGTSDPHRAFAPTDRQALVALAEATAIGLRAAASREDRDARIHRLTELNAAAARLATAEDAPAIARVAWETCGRLVARDSFYLALYEANRKLIHFVFMEDRGLIVEREASDPWNDDSVVPLGEGPTSRVITSGEVFVTHTSADSVQLGGSTFGDAQARSESTVHVPLKIGEVIVGVLSAQSYRPHAYDQEDVAVLHSLGILVGSALAGVEHLRSGRELYLASVKALAAAVDARDPYTRSHSARVAALSRLIAEELGLPADEIRRVQLGALLHDIGKIGIPDAILNKPAALTPDEWLIMQTHSALGASILAAVEPLRDLVPIVRAHHERFDGRGYPDGQAGEQIPLGARIVAAADAFEVIISKRAYKAARPVEEGLAELRLHRGTQFAPDVADALLAVLERDRAHGAVLLRRIEAIEHEDIEDLPGPGELLERYALTSQIHGRQLAILQRLASEISAVLDIDELADRLLRIICDAVGCESGYLTTLDVADDSLLVRSVAGASAGFMDRLPRGVGISWWVMEHGVLQNVPDVRQDPRFVGQPEIRSSLVVPLRIGDERIGILGIESTRVGAFGPQDEQLLTAVSHQVAAAVRVARLHEAAKTAATTDQLTGLPNRRAFFARLERGLIQAAAGVPLSVAMIDVNLLKVINDRLGHGAGDEALVRVGELIAAGVRDADLVARIGGDEFAVVFPGAPLPAAERIMRRLAEAIAQATLAGGEVLPTIAWGVAAAGPGDQQSVDALVDAADRAMYRHKQLSRASRSTA